MKAVSQYGEKEDSLDRTGEYKCFPLLRANRDSSILETSCILGTGSINSFRYPFTAESTERLSVLWTQSRTCDVLHQRLGL